MRLQDWEGTIQQMLGECNNDPKGADRILKTWRSKLEQAPMLLQPFEIDKIIREVRQRLNRPSQ